MNKLLEINNLGKNYHTKNGEIKAIDNVSFDVYEKEFLCIIGSSGCGKSTLLNILAGLDTLSSGKIKKKRIKYRLHVTGRCPISMVNYLR